MKKLLFTVIFLATFAISAQVEPIRVNLDNGDVANCLIQVNAAEGYKLISVYKNKQDKTVFVFLKGKKAKTFISK